MTDHTTRAGALAHAEECAAATRAEAEQAACEDEVARRNARASDGCKRLRAAVLLFGGLPYDVAAWLADEVRRLEAVAAWTLAREGLAIDRPRRKKRASPLPRPPARVVVLPRRRRPRDEAAGQLFLSFSRPTEEVSP